MLQTLQVQCFRKLRENTFTFTPGMNVIRGENEAGKSTMLEAISYALFGVKGCRASLDDLVTWGEAVSKLKVVLTFSMEGRTYTLKRSKGGAEMNWDGGTVVGQNEVTAFIGRLFGVPPQNIGNLMLANQGQIRGALDKGSKATSELIEDLADFDLIDTVVTLIGEKLLIGAPAPFEEKIARLIPELEACEQALAVVPDTAAAEARLSELEPRLAGLNARSATILKDIEPACAKRDAAAKLVEERERLRARVELLEQQMAAAQIAEEAQIAAEPPAPSTTRAVEIHSLLADLGKVARLHQVKAAVEAYAYPAVFWDEPLEAFHAHVDKLQTRAKEIQIELINLSNEAATKRAQLVSASACGICGKDVSEIPEVKAKNAAIEHRLGQIETLRAAHEAVHAEHFADLRDLEAIQRSQTELERLGAGWGDAVSYNKDNVPWRPIFIAKLPPAGDGGVALRKELAALDAAQTAVTVWQTNLAAARAALERASAALAAGSCDALQDRFTVAADALPGLEKQCADLNNDYATVVSEIGEIKDTVSTLRNEVRSKRAVYDAAKAKVTSVVSQLDEAKRDLDSVNFNNALLKRVRAARPVIANKLWSKVLGAVSRYLSQMRGEESVVTKDGDGFKINAKLIENYSGSALDLLGLSIRLGCIRTFLPHIPFLVMDEPAAACSDARTESMVAFLAGAGFSQMLLVTHEDLSEKVASSLIEI